MAPFWVYATFLALGITGLATGIVNLRRALASTRWPIQEAVVLESTVTRTRGAMTGSRYIPSIRYRFQEQGKTYDGDRIMFSGIPLSASREEAERFIAPFRAGSSLTVHVAPHNPEISVIKPGIDGRLRVLLFAAAWFILMGASGVLGWWK